MHLKTINDVIYGRAETDKQTDTQIAADNDRQTERKRAKMTDR